MTAPHKLSAAVLVAAACALVPAGASADPIILNPNFSAGNTGFTSGYSYVNPPSLPNAWALWPEGTYTVGANPHDYHYLWPGFGDHTTGNGGMLIVNGNRDEDVVVWSTTVGVTPNTQYDLSAWVASVYYESPSSLAFSINGVPLNAPYNLSSTPGVWGEFTAAWFSGDQSTAVLSLVDWNSEWSGNDFAVDDISLRETQLISDISLDDPEIESVPEPASSMALLGLGLAGLAGLKKRWSR
jgi:hypothetical protein